MLPTHFKGINNLSREITSAWLTKTAETTKRNGPTSDNNLWSNNLTLFSFSVSLLILMIFVTEEEKKEDKGLPRSPIADALGLHK